MTNGKITPKYRLNEVVIFTGDGLRYEIYRIHTKLSIYSREILYDLRRQGRVEHTEISEYRLKKLLKVDDNEYLNDDRDIIQKTWDDYEDYKELHCLFKHMSEQDERVNYNNEYLDNANLARKQLDIMKNQFKEDDK